MAKKKTTSPATYLEIVGGQLAKFVNEPTPDSKPFTDKDGKTRNYEYFESAVGKLESIYIFDKELDDKRSFEVLVIKLKNEEGTDVIQVPFKSSYARAFILRIPNIDAEKELEIKSFKIKDDKKSKEKGISVYNEMLLPYQDGEALVNPYKKDGELAAELPQAVVSEVKEKGVKVKKYDFTSQEEYLRELVNRLKEGLKNSTESAPATESASADSDDDLPF